MKHITPAWSPQAVILANGLYPSADRPLRMLAQAPFVVCCDGAADTYLANGLVPDVIIGDGDSLAPETVRQYGAIIHREAEQETNDLSKAFRYVHGKGIERVAILGATGKRDDHTLGNISLLVDYMRGGADVRMYTDYGVFVPCSGDTCFESRKGQQISVFSFGATGLQAEGLVYPLFDFDNWWQGTLNECVDNAFTIHAQGDFLVFLND